MATVTVTPIVALDVADRAGALALLDTLGESCRFYKIGSELFTREGPRVVADVRDRGSDVFLDLKFHDIPNTVRGAVRAAASLGVSLLTVHASGGRAMLDAAAAASASSSGGHRCKVLAVSVLTSLDEGELAEAWGRSAVSVQREVVRLAGLAAEAGLDGLVCSALEARGVRGEHGNRLELLIPGIRLAGSTSDDQARIATPAAAAEAGATYIILGRTVTAAVDPRAAMRRVADELATALASSPRG